MTEDAIRIEQEKSARWIAKQRADEAVWLKAQQKRDTEARGKLTP